MAIKIHLYFVLLLSLLLFPSLLQAKEKNFTVVIDAGHGGKDPGARGTTINEKVINLSVALKLGSRIEANHSDVTVVYTRKTDRFIELDERANIANRAKADLFISIHTNSVKKGSSVRGTETFTLGLARTDENLEVAMRENSAILLEDDYLQKYEGFDPNSSESYIIFEFMQNKHLEQSIELASEIQNAFSSLGRVNRGVRQGGLLVLRKTSMPSVLVELGFISNQSEENFMKSADGQEKMTQSLYNAFCKYKKNYDKKSGGLTLANNSPVPQKGPRVQEEEKTNIPDRQPQVEKSTLTKARKNQVVYKIQILTADTKLSSKSRQFKGYENISYYTEKGIYKYTYGEYTDFNTAKKQRRSLLKDFKDAFIVAFKNGEKTTY